MADLLIYNKVHWIERTDAKRLDMLKAKYETKKDGLIAMHRKFEGHWRKGDVVDVKPDGWFDKHPTAGPFIVVKAPQMSLKAARAQLLQEGEIHRRKLRISNLPDVTHTGGKMPTVEVGREIATLTLTDKEP